MTSKLLKVTLLALMSLSVQLRADDAEFGKRKAEMLTEIDQHIQKLNEHKNCVSAASSGDALKTCHETMKQWREAERQEMMQKHKAHLDEKIQKLQQKRNELNNSKK